MKKYLQFKSAGELETIDELNSVDFKTLKEFKAEMKRLITEYSMCFHGELYWSNRACKSWSK